MLVIGMREVEEIKVTKEVKFWSSLSLTCSSIFNIESSVALAIPFLLVQLPLESSGTTISLF